MNSVCKMNGRPFEESQPETQTASSQLDEQRKFVAAEGIGRLAHGHSAVRTISIHG